MYYQFNKLFIGTLAENKENVRIHHGEIICIKLGKNAVIDLIGGTIYDINEDGYYSGVTKGKTYVSALNECFPKEFPKYIFKWETLMKLVMALNNTWASIEIPSEDFVKVKRIG